MAKMFCWDNDTSTQSQRERGMRRKQCEWSGQSREGEIPMKQLRNLLSDLAI